MENEWLKGWKGFLLGDYVDDIQQRNIEDLTDKIDKEIEEKLKISIDRSLLKVWINLVLIFC